MYKFADFQNLPGLPLMYSNGFIFADNFRNDNIFVMTSFFLLVQKKCVFINFLKVAISGK